MAGVTLLRLAKNNAFSKIISNFKYVASITAPPSSFRKYSMVPMSENGPNPYIERENESKTDKKARLLYQSRKRGMLENGLILSSFAAKYLHEFDDERLELYDKLINKPSNDWDIFYWATGVKDTPTEFQNEVMELLKDHVKNKLKETRYVQPDLNQ